MKEYLTELSVILNDIDNNPVKSLQFFTTALVNTNIVNKPIDECRMKLITEILFHISLRQVFSEEYAQKNTDKILQSISTKYTNNQNLCWLSHSHHFHSSFEEYVNCPVTCLYELVEFFEKLKKECYVQ